MRRRTILVGSSAVVLGGVLAAWWFYTGTPEYSLGQLAAATQAHERLGVEEYVDVHSVAVAAVDELVQKQMTTSLREGSTDNPFAALGTALGMSMVQNMKPVLAARLEQALWAMAGEDAARPVSDNVALRAPDLRDLKARYRGIVGSERRGTRARVRLALQRASPDTSTVLLALRLEKADHHWRVIAVEGLGEQLVSEVGFGTPEGDTPLQRAYIASMKSDLRNLVTAEEAYFADSVKYTAKFGRGGLIFYVTRGNTLPHVRLTSDGWTATIESASISKTCAIFIGSTPISPATREGEPKCQ